MEGRTPNITMNELFFELIQVAIGKRESLTKTPTPQQWHVIYDMAKKQSLVGICFAALQRLGADVDDGFSRIGMSEMLYLTWMGMTAKIQQRNALVNHQCVALQSKLFADGLDAVILKGQGVALQYPEHLRGLRQAGDIDVWIDASREQILAYVNSISPTEDTGDLHISLSLFPDTEVEVHFTPSIASGRKTDRRLQEWFERQKGVCFKTLSGSPVRGDSNIHTPSVEFNLVYLLHHIFRHYIYEGIGLRQILDYYFVLLHSNKDERIEAMEVIKELHMAHFSAAMMWLLHDVLCLSAEYCLCTPDEKRGRRLLEVVMEGGNFGHGTEKYKVTGWDKPWSRLSRYVRRNWYMLQDYPDEIIANMIKKLKRVNILNSFPKAINH